METKRKGAKSFKDLPKNILKQLNEGTIESVNLTEWLAVDAKVLLANFLEQNDRTIYLSPILFDVYGLKKQSVNTINEAIGRGLLREAKSNKDAEFLMIASNHVSDTVRCWATYMIGYNDKLSVEQKLEQMQTLAADSHFGVREIAWMALRSHLVRELEKSIEILTKWTGSDDENVRRFASESIRPRGVWCEHISILKEQPELALSILEPLKSDSSKYVRDSVANWLNDASKTQPLFVIDLCNRWQQESSSKETAYIVKKALRTLNK